MTDIHPLCERAREALCRELVAAIEGSDNSADYVDYKGKPRWQERDVSDPVNAALAPLKAILEQQAETIRGQVLEEAWKAVRDCNGEDHDTIEAAMRAIRNLSAGPVERGKT